MANKPLKTIKFPGLADTYTIPQIDTTLAVSGRAADAKATGDAIADVVEDVTALQAELPDLTETVMSAFVTDTASGAIATFPDGADNVPVKALTVDIEPVQDLHGQSSPYPGGGGKNKLEVTATTDTVNGVTFTINTDGTTIVNGTATGSIVFPLHGYQPLSDYGIEVNTQYIMSGTPANLGDGCYLMLAVYGSGTEWRDLGSSASLTPSDVSKQYRVVIVVNTGVTVTNALFKPMICLASATDPTTFAPYSNICPITGWSEAKVTRTGVNVWDEEWEEGSYGNSGSKITQSGILRNKNIISVVPNTTYYVKMPTGTTYGMWFWLYDAEKNYIGRYNNGSGVQSGTLTIADNVHYINFALAGVTPYGNNISINYPSTDHDYHAYQGQTYTIDLSGTRYGGTLDVGTGVLTVDRQYWTDDGTKNWVRNNDGGFYVLTISLFI